MKKLFYLLLLLFVSCKSQDCPPIHNDLSERKYEQYCSQLKDARAKKNYFKEGSTLNNLKQPSEKVYKLLNKGIKQHDSICYEVHYLQNLHKTGALTVNIIKADSIKWKKLCKSCEKIVPLELFYIKEEEKSLAYQQKKALAANKIDTNLIDRKLVACLKEIMKDDKKIRGIPSMDSKNTRWKEQKHLDSLNLVKIDSLFKMENGYPSMEKTGYDLVTVPWYVLHHQSSPIIRRKYQHFIEEAVRKGFFSKSMLETFNERTLDNEERLKRERP